MMNMLPPPPPLADAITRLTAHAAGTYDYATDETRPFGGIGADRTSVVNAVLRGDPALLDYINMELVGRPAISPGLRQLLVALMTITLVAGLTTILWLHR